jgi:hypothetical protein
MWSSLHARWKAWELKSRMRTLRAELTEAKKYKLYYEHKIEFCEGIIRKLEVEIILAEKEKGN